MQSRSEPGERNGTARAVSLILILPGCDCIWTPLTCAPGGGKSGTLRPIAAVPVSGELVGCQAETSLPVMAARSRRGSTLASSMATASLTRQREELHEQALADAPRYPTGKRKATRPVRPKERQPKKPRRPRRWAPPGWDGVTWTARSVHPGGLETHHEPNMSAFFSADQPSTGLSWLKPRNQVSIWEHMAEVQRRRDVAAAVAAAAGPGTDSVLVPTSSETEMKEKKVVASGTATVVHDRALPASASNSCPKPTHVELPRAAKTVPADYTVPVGQPDRVAEAVSRSPTLSLCGAPATAAAANVDRTLSPALKTPAASCPADRISIVSLVG